jgi:hypothetical protein
MRRRARRYEGSGFATRWTVPTTVRGPLFFEEAQSAPYLASMTVDGSGGTLKNIIRQNFEELPVAHDKGWLHWLRMYRNVQAFHCMLR